MQLPAQRFTVTRADLVRYAGASGDFNPIHWSDRFATGVGLPGVIGHGMFTMALAARAVATWAGGPDAVVEFNVRFTRPVVVPDTDDGTEIEVTGVVKGATEAGLTRIDVTAVCAGEKVLSQARALVRTRE
ncbi:MULTISPECIES: MaoC/PaaZ C-terminal domain-containing protein [unclassified Solwaraspora]|uniref:MaoC/PaaZ C-terminal domain-containing protein n=1 Tax=unclassified Solwaraspora TaxID=2627926 RepID=UPI00259B49C1|nr:MaoC/PaaZ C-terminal domain-containing protein [Solwaraspora sp. WMMA2056]WJK42260.1 MaoC/PaaZ C-terminal domain-containing protein [Solwaraspora sp. WMMA2056]